MSNPSTTLRILLLAVAVAVAGCGRKNSAGYGDAKTIDDLGELPWLSSSPNVAMQDHLTRIRQQQGTPNQLDAHRPPDAQNVAVGLAAVFDSRRISRIDRQAERLFPSGRFEFDAIRLQKVMRFVSDHSDQRENHPNQRTEIRKALTRPRCRFDLQFSKGLLATLPDLQIVRTCVRLEGLAIAEILFDKQRPSGTIEPLGVMLRLVAYLAAEKHLASRLEAARLRRETMSVLEAVAQHPKTNTSVLRGLLDLVGAQLESWPADADAWIGDRALGLHTYELVRAGELMSLLTSEETRRFRKRGTPGDLFLAVKRNIDRDEGYYLDTIETIIAACNEPYYKRRGMFGQIRTDLNDRENTAKYPFVSGRILLDDIENGQQLQARDLALCQSWAVALAMACGESPSAYKVSPLSGEPYDVQRGDRAIVFSVPTTIGISATRRVAIPRRDVQSKAEKATRPATNRSAK